MTWPPSERVWCKVLEDLPPRADPIKFRAAVDAAIEIYLFDDHDAEIWKRIARLAKSKSVAKLRAEINKLEKKVRPPAVSDWCRALEKIIEVSDFQAQFTKSRNFGRRERLYSNLLIAWTGAGCGRLGNSASGPLARTMQTILAQVLPPPAPDPRGIKDIVLREKKRRAAAALDVKPTKF